MHFSWRETNFPHMWGEIRAKQMEPSFRRLFFQLQERNVEFPVKAGDGFFHRN